MDSQDQSGTRGIRRSELPWYLGGGFTVASAAAGLAVCAAAWYFAWQGSREPPWRVCAHLTLLGLLLGLVGGLLRSRALASVVPAVEPAPAEEACLRALSTSAAGRGSLAAEVIGLLAAVALGVAARSWTPPALLYGALTAAEQLAYLSWLRRQPW